VIHQADYPDFAFFDFTPELVGSLDEDAPDPDEFFLRIFHGSAQSTNQFTDACGIVALDSPNASHLGRYPGFCTYILCW
jgi:hypothetical protein